MWNFLSKNSGRNETTSRAESRLGARKVALFLSVLEPNDAEQLLSLLDSGIARAVAEEAKTIDVVTPEDIEGAVSDFLDAVGCDSLDADLTNALIAEARHNVRARPLETGSFQSESKFSSSSPLDSIASERLSTLLKSERLSTLAAVLPKLPVPSREVLLETFPVNTRRLISHFSVKSRVTPSLKRLEDVLFERSYDD